MKKLGPTLLFSSVVAFLGLAMQVQAQDAAPGIDEEAMMEKWQAFMTPGAEHELLKERVGKWDMKITMWMAPGAPASESEGTTTLSMIMGDRYLLDRTSSSFDGMPFEGMSIVGYDNMKKKFVSIWIDNMGTGLMQSEGTYDKSTKTLTFDTMGPDVMTGKYEKMRSVEKIISKDKWIVEMYKAMPDGKDFKTMEITYTRTK